MSHVVTGFGSESSIDALKAALLEGGFEIDSLQTIDADDAQQSLASGLAGADLITSDSGTGVPGMNTRANRPFFRSEGLSDRLGDLHIPDSELDNYLEAVERGRTVVAYFAAANTAEGVESAFRASGITNVRQY